MFHTKPDFLSPKAFAALLEARANGEFVDTQSGVDGVVYPRICQDIPDLVRQEVEFLAQKPPSLLFMRESPLGVQVPNQAHTDNSMGRMSLMLYLEDAPEGVRAGTSFLRHRVLGVSYAPMLPELVRIVQEDANTPSQWAVNAFCPARANTACIFDAGQVHRAEPIGGYGEGLGARCVLTGFFE